MDPERLRRALGLTVTDQGAGTYCVTGGARPHHVEASAPGRWDCDCADAALRPGQRCKHVLAVYVARQLAPAVLAALRILLLQTSASRPTPKRRRRRLAA